MTCVEKKQHALGHSLLELDLSLPFMGTLLWFPLSLLYPSTCTWVLLRENVAHIALESEQSKQDGSRDAWQQASLLFLPLASPLGFYFLDVTICISWKAHFLLWDPKHLYPFHHVTRSWLAIFPLFFPVKASDTEYVSASIWVMNKNYLHFPKNAFCMCTNACSIKATQSQILCRD